jgi:hypothetical protein
MIDQLTAMGWGIVMLAIVIVIGATIIGKFGNVIGGTSNETAAYLNTQLGQQGLAGYVPLIIIAAIGLGILGWFMAGNSKGRKV